MNMETEVKPKAKRVRRKKQVKEYNNSLEAIMGLLEGKIFGDDAIFNLGVKS